MTQNLPRTLTHSVLVLLVLMTPPASDAVEQRNLPVATTDLRITNHPMGDSKLVQIVSDSWRKGTIDAAFLLNKNLESGDIDVSVEEGIAKLTGEVDAEIKKSLAEQIALSVDGIKKVRNFLTVKKTKHSQALTKIKFEVSQEDALLKATVNQKLLSHKHLKSALIDVRAHEGIVELSGDAPEAAVRDLAYYLAKNVSGVKSVDNKIKVRVSTF